MAIALPTLRERKRLRTRDALAAAALELSRRHGFESVTVEQIAAEAEVSRRTFFRYFPTKEAAIFAHHAARLARFRAFLEGFGSAQPFETVRGAFLALAVDWMRDREQIVAQQRVVDSSPALVAFELSLDREWERAVASALEGRRAPRGPAGRRARVLAGATMGAIRAALREWFDADGRTDLVALGREIFEQLTPAGRASGGAQTGHSRPAPTRTRRK
jgi:AcrR family transcriptional regulator